MSLSEKNIINKIELTKTRALGAGLIVLAIAAILFGMFYSSSKSQESLIFSNKLLVNELWTSYKNNYLEKDTYRTLDKDRNYITTSEGQSYTMLRAVEVDDKQVFDQSWNWTKYNLQRKDNNLFSWKFGKKASGDYGILTDQGGDNTASDADQDIALSLIFASKKWQSPIYMDEAKKIISEIWKYEVINIQGKPVLVSNNLEKVSTADTALLNPSYFEPYAYKIFAKIDTANDWNSLYLNSYDIINTSLSENLDKSSSAGLVPDWINIDKKSGVISAPNFTNITTNFGYDALRTPFRLAVDWEWNKEPKAKETLDKMKFLSDEYNSKKLLYSTYTHDGQPVVNYESPAFYGGTIGYFMVSDSKTGADVYKTKLQTLYDSNTLNWKSPLNYYDDNWAWFGLTLYTNFFVDLSK